MLHNVSRMHTILFLYQQQGLMLIGLHFTSIGRTIVAALDLQYIVCYIVAEDKQ